MAQALGGRVEKYPGGWSVGPEVYELEGISDAACVMAWHQDQVIEKPAAAEIAGSSPFCEYAALSYGDRALTIQPHPEFDAEYVADLVVARRNILPDYLAEKTLTGLDKALSSAAIADQIEAFFKKPRDESAMISANRSHDQTCAGGPNLKLKWFFRQPSSICNRTFVLEFSAAGYCGQHQCAREIRCCGGEMETIMSQTGSKEVKIQNQITERKHLPTPGEAAG